MKIWSSFPVLSAPMPLQMALDEILFRRMVDRKVSRPLLRFYYSSEPWISVGYSYRGLETAGNIPHCRRITGGGLVVHGKDVIFSILAPQDEDESFSSVRVSYWKIHEAVKGALEMLGEKPRFYRCDEKLPRGRECFIYPIATDLELNGKKVAGGSQKRSGGILLHQESVQIPARMEAENFVKAAKEQFEKHFQMHLERSVFDLDLFEEAKQWSMERADEPQRILESVVV